MNKDLIFETFGSHQVFAESTKTYLSEFRSANNLSKVEKALESIKKIKTLVIGDLIMDEYVFCQVAGTVTKAPVVAGMYRGELMMAGGGAIISRHIRQFSESVDYLATTGDKNDLHKKAAEILAAEKIKFENINWPDTFTVLKRRYISGGYPNPLNQNVSAKEFRSNTRLFEVGYMPQGALDKETEKQMCSRVEKLAANHDLIVVADFGHGTLNPAIVEQVSKSGAFWSLNAQTNSSNFGFNRVTKYNKANFICIDELEARLPSGDRTSSLEDVGRRLRDELNTPVLMITRGANGIVVFSKNTTIHAPALASKVVDTVGAGDAVLSIASLCFAAGVDHQIAVFFSLCFGALASMTIGNESPVLHEDFHTLVEILLESKLA